MIEQRLHTAFVGGWVCAVPFVLFQAPMWCQLLALAMGALIASVYSTR